MDMVRALMRIALQYLVLNLVIPMDSKRKVSAFYAVGRWFESRRERTQTQVIIRDYSNFTKNYCVAGYGYM